jgi:hypothetical protein
MEVDLACQVYYYRVDRGHLITGERALYTNKSGWLKKSKH